jgi:hypothetical protein
MKFTLLVRSDNRDPWMPAAGRGHKTMKAAIKEALRRQRINNLQYDIRRAQ